MFAAVKKTMMGIICNLQNDLLKTLKLKAEPKKKAKRASTGKKKVARRAVSAKA